MSLRLAMGVILSFVFSMLAGRSPLRSRRRFLSRMPGVWLCRSRLVRAMSRCTALAGSGTILSRSCRVSLTMLGPFFVDMVDFLGKFWLLSAINV